VFIILARGKGHGGECNRPAVQGGSGSRYRIDRHATYDLEPGQGMRCVAAMMATSKIEMNRHL